MRIKVGPVDVTVTPLDRMTAVERGVCGLYHSATKKIEVSPRQTPQTQAAILIHELLHAVWDVHAIPKDGEEAMILRLEAPLAGIIRDNPELLGVLHQALCNDVPVVRE